jgi:hypothetical protein
LRISHFSGYNLQVTLFRKLLLLQKLSQETARKT